MKKLIFIIIAMLGVTGVASAARAESVSLYVGQQKSVDGGQITISFLSVVDDSRCPVNVQCVWAGNAKIKIAIAQGRSQSQTFELNSALDPRVINAFGYEIGFGDLTRKPAGMGRMPMRPLATLNVNKPAVRSDEELRIRIGQQKVADHGKVSIKFISVFEDSRCPMNARCIQAGNAKIRVVVTKGRSSRTVKLNTNNQPQSVTVLGYQLALQDLAPHKGEPHKMIARPETATITVMRSGR
ncbi:MAG: hypothetical protein ABJB40_10700 [Acidobacteriota bacterium]